MALLDAVVGMTYAEFVDGGQQFFEMIETVHDQRERADELSPLFAHVAVEETAHGWFEREEPLIETSAHLGGIEADFCEGLAN